MSEESDLAPKQKQPPGLSGLSMLLVTLFSLPALQPLLNGRLTCGFDNVFHLWRSVQIGALLEEGILFSRWAPHMAHGFGYPLFLFQSPFSAYFVAVVQMAGFSWPVALNMIYGLGLLASGWTMWLLGRDLWGTRGAIVTAVAYVFAPYHAYITYYRASLSETVAWLFMPLILWGLLRWQGPQKQRRGLVTAVLAFILLVFTHDVTAYAFFPFIVGWISVLALSQRSGQALGRGVLALGLGLGGSAFFWLPSLVERPFIQFERANSAWPFLYFNNFLPAEQLLAWPRNADPALLNDWPERGLGILLLVLAVAGATIAWKQMPRLRWLVGFLALSLIGYLFLTVAVSRPLWEIVTGLQAFQFPWRFLAPVTLVAALLSGGCVLIVGEGAAVNGRRLIDIALPLAIVTLVSVAHGGWFYPDHCDAPADLSLAGMVAWEKATGTLGTTAGRELLPNDVEILPKDTHDLPVWEARLDESLLQPGRQTMLAATYTPLQANIALESTESIPVRFRAFYYPGWRVWINDTEVETWPTPEHGLLAFNIPEGNSTIRVEFGETRLRLFADALSILSLLLLGIITFRVKTSPSEKSTCVEAQGRFLIAGFVVAFVLLGCKLILADGGYLPLRTSQLQNGQLTPVDESSHLTFGTPANPALIRLLGHDALPTAVAADEPLILSFYWQALAPLMAEYRVGLTLVDEQGIRWSEEGLRDYRWARGAPLTQSWPLDKYVQTAFFADLLSGTPPGNYALQLSLFDKDTLHPLTVYDGTTPIGPSLHLHDIVVEEPKQPVSNDSFTIQFPLTIKTNGFTVSGAAVSQAQASPGDGLLISLYWQNETDGEKGLTLELVEAGGTAVAEWPVQLPALGNSYYRHQFIAPLPARLSAGVYSWRLVDDVSATEQFGQLTIDAPVRLYDPPAVDTAVAESLFNDDQNMATLVGYNIDADACTKTPTMCPIQLVWLANAEFDASYRVFLQLLSGEGQMISQSDGIPGNWQRQTTGWLPGEYIMDTHFIDVSLVADDLTTQLITGLYHQETGRLLADNGRDFIQLPQGTIRFSEDP